MGGDHSVVSVSNSVKKPFEEYCFKIGVKQQHVVDRLLLAEISKGVSDDDVKVASLLREASSAICQLDQVKNLMSKVNLYDGYSDSNLKETLAKLNGADEEYTDLVTRVYQLGKKRVSGARDALKTAVEILEKQPESAGQGEVEAKPIGHTLEEWRAMRNKKESEAIEEPKQLGREPRFKREPTLEEIAEMNRRNKHPFGDKNKW